MYLIRPKVKKMVYALSENVVSSEVNSVGIEFCNGINYMSSILNDDIAIMHTTDEIFESMSSVYGRGGANIELQSVYYLRLSNLLAASVSKKDNKTNVSLNNIIAGLKRGSIKFSNWDEKNIELFEDCVAKLCEFGQRPMTEKRWDFLRVDRNDSVVSRTPTGKIIAKAIKDLSSLPRPTESSFSSGAVSAFLEFIRLSSLIMRVSNIKSYTKLSYTLEEYDLEEAALYQKGSSILDAFSVSLESDRLVDALNVLINQNIEASASMFSVYRGMVAIKDKEFSLYRNMIKSIVSLLVDKTNAIFTWRAKKTTFEADLIKYQSYYEIAQVVGSDIKFRKELLFQTKGVFDKKSQLWKGSVITWDEVRVKEWIDSFEFEYQDIIVKLTEFISMYFVNLPINWRPTLSTLSYKRGKDRHIYRINIKSNYVDSSPIVMNHYAVNGGKVEADNVEIIDSLRTDIRNANVLYGYKQEDIVSGSNNVLIENVNALSWWELSTIEPLVLIKERVEHTLQCFYQLRIDTYRVVPSRMCEFDNYIEDEAAFSPCEGSARVGQPILEAEELRPTQFKNKLSMSIADFSKLWYSLPEKAFDRANLDQDFKRLNDKLLSTDLEVYPYSVYPNVKSYKTTVFEPGLMYDIISGFNKELRTLAENICLNKKTSKNSGLSLPDYEMDSTQTFTIPVKWANRNKDYKARNAEMGVRIEDKTWPSSSLNYGDAYATVNVKLDADSSSVHEKYSISKIIKDGKLFFKVKYNAYIYPFNGINDNEAFEYSLYDGACINKYYDPFVGEESPYEIISNLIIGLYVGLRHNIIEKTDINARRACSMIHAIGDWLSVKCNSKASFSDVTTLKTGLKVGELSDKLKAFVATDFIDMNDAKYSKFQLWCETDLVGTDLMTDYGSCRPIILPDDMISRYLDDKQTGVNRPLSLIMDYPDFNISYDQDAFFYHDEVNDLILWILHMKMTFMAESQILRWND